jgi:hypothetical protein
VPHTVARIGSQSLIEISACAAWQDSGRTLGGPYTSPSSPRRISKQDGRPEVRPSFVHIPEGRYKICRNTSALEPEIITETLVSVITRSYVQGEQETVPRSVAVKAGHTRRTQTKEPHDIIKELRMLSSLSHPSVGNLVGSLNSFL